MVYVADTHFVDGICHAFLTKSWRMFAKCRLAELEDDREGVGYGNGAIALLSRCPLR